MVPIWGPYGTVRYGTVLYGTVAPHSYPHGGVYGQSEGILERINEPPWGRCLQGAVGARWVVVVVVGCRRRPTGGSGLTSGRDLGSTVRLLRSNGDVSMGLDDQAKPADPNSPKNFQKSEQKQCKTLEFQKIHHF